VQVIGLVLLHGAGFYLLYVYLSTYLATVTNVPLGSVLTINTTCMILLALLIPLMGRLSDTIGQKPLLAAGAAGLALTSYPMFVWLISEYLPLMLIAQVFLTVLMSCYLGPFFAAAVELFPTRLRYTGLSIGYNVASALFGGTAPLIASISIQWSGYTLAPSLYLSLCAIISLTVVLTLHESDQSREIE
jgi:MHS family proline/betaine transporter-like MFS transporter